MKIGIIIPVVQTELAKKLIEQLAQGTVKPDKLIIIDVSEYGQGIINPHFDLDIAYRRYPPQCNRGYYMPDLGTNEAWTLGYDILAKYIPYYGIAGFLNDDIEISPYFIQNISLSYNTHKNISLLYPQTVGKLSKLQDVQVSYKVRKTKTRNGYAWFIPRQIFDEIPPFPEECKIWYGDNWIMSHLRRLGYSININYGNYVYHHGHITSTQLKIDLSAHNLHLSKRRREEHKSYLRAIRKWREGNKND
ncbi:MAG: glycosyltransferase family 2 protein [Candidatus Thorarchaeota archaeon]